MSINDGLALIRRHDFEGALPLLAAEVRKRPDDAYATYYLAYAFVGAQDPQPAVTLLAKIIEVHPDFTDAHTLLRLARIRTSDFAGARTRRGGRCAKRAAGARKCLAGRCASLASPWHSPSCRQPACPERGMGCATTRMARRGSRPWTTPAAPARWSRPWKRCRHRPKP